MDSQREHQRDRDRIGNCVRRKLATNECSLSLPTVDPLHLEPTDGLPKRARPARQRGGTGRHLPVVLPSVPLIASRTRPPPPGCRFSSLPSSVYSGAAISDQLSAGGCQKSSLILAIYRHGFISTLPLQLCVCAFACGIASFSSTRARVLAMFALASFSPSLSLPCHLPLLLWPIATVPGVRALISQLVCLPVCLKRGQFER